MLTRIWKLILIAIELVVTLIAVLAIPFLIQKCLSALTIVAVLLVLTVSIIIALTSFKHAIKNPMRQMSFAIIAFSTFAVASFLFYSSPEPAKYEPCIFSLIFAFWLPLLILDLVYNWSNRTTDSKYSKS